MGGYSGCQFGARFRQIAGDPWHRRHVPRSKNRSRLVPKIWFGRRTQTQKTSRIPRCSPAFCPQARVLSSFFLAFLAHVRTDPGHVRRVQPRAFRGDFRISPPLPRDQTHSEGPSSGREPLGRLGMSPGDSRKTRWPGFHRSFIYSGGLCDPRFKDWHGRTSIISEAQQLQCVIHEAEHTVPGLPSTISAREPKGGCRGKQTDTERQSGTG